MSANPFPACEVNKVANLHLVNSVNDCRSFDRTFIAANIQKLSSLKLVRRARNSFDHAKKDKGNDYRCTFHLLPARLPNFLHWDGST